MSKTAFLLACLVLAYPAAGLYAQNFAGAPKKEIAIEEPSLELKTGEILEYSMEWLGLNVGEVVLKVAGIEKIDGHPCYHINALARPNNFLRRIVDLEYEVDSYLDTELFVSRRFIKKRRLNGQASFNQIDFYPEKNKVDYKTKGGAVSYKVSPKRAQAAQDNPDTDEIPDGTQDLLSSLYYLRRVELQAGREYEVNIYYHHKNWVSTFSVEKPFVKEIRKKGSFEVFRVFPSSGLNDFIMGENKFSIYFTADPRRIPVEFSFKTAVGSISARLQKVLLQ